MENILIYLENHYIMFIVLTVLMLFALAGYFAKKKSDQDQPYKLADENTRAEEELENLAQKVQKGASLQDFMSHNVTISPELQQNQSNQTVSNVTPVETVPVQQVAMEQTIAEQPVTPVEQTVAEPTGQVENVQNNVDNLI